MSSIKHSVDNGHGVGHDRTEYALISDIGNLEDVLDVSLMVLGMTGLNTYRYWQSEDVLNVSLGVGHDRTKYIPVLAAWRMCWT